ncbi:hypothetical protein BCR34DRAFT_525763 [Clohesyomyces aquaticus]|uniref:tyrosinase n=1 Tax=Clohesyomyces aquaticus TaxID=1231657 RepID=A0A1Y1YAL0_9PLEO|nr:hypothetical protein BCR34DRAFT_525763 [Clohesyomyces aquaticus]
MRITHLTAASLLSSLGHASPLSQMSRFLEIETRQSPGSYFAITGATGGVYPRLEIRELEKTGEMWNLYLLAMISFQGTNQDDIASYYQIAGIHGMPWVPWDGVAGSINDDKNTNQLGYCPHANLLFGTWHRPYLALFEQQLQKHATNIANQFASPAKSTYQAAAIKLRIPFWDWAKALPTSEPVLPTAVTSEKISVTFPNGTKASVDNPLFDYNFHPLDHSQINGTGCPVTGTQNGPVGGLPEVCDNDLMTVRNGVNASDHPGLDKKLRNILPSQRTGVYAILSQWQHFDSFSNQGNCGPGGGAGTLEAVHNPIHTQMWPGHMSPASVAAFDPIFWMHHANVDRQMALYQVVFPETYVEQCPADTPTYSINRGDLLDANSPLTPFHKNAKGDWWTSANSRNTRDMGYTYPELASNPSNSTLVKQIKTLYGPATGFAAKYKRQNHLPSRSTKQTRYLAKVEFPVYGLNAGAPYNVLMFLGNVSSDSKTWLGSEAFVGLASSLGGVNMRSEMVATATVDLNDKIEKKIGSKELTVEGTVEYLRANLRWRMELGENEIPKKEVEGIKVVLISTEVEVAEKDDVFDRWVGGFVEHGEVDI